MWTSRGEFFCPKLGRNNQSALGINCMVILAHEHTFINVDGTLGGGGHALEVVKRLEGKGRFFGIDQDEAAIEAIPKAANSSAISLISS